VAPLAESILQNLCETLGDPEPRVAAKACLAIHNFAISFQEQQANPIGTHFVDVVRMLLLCADRPEADEENLRVSAYEALNIVLDTCPATCDEALGQVCRAVLFCFELLFVCLFVFFFAVSSRCLTRKVLKVMVERLEKTFSMEILSQDDVNVQNELQGLLCGVLQVLVTRLGARLKPLADLLMKQLIFLFASKKDASVYEEAMLTVTAIVVVTEGDFVRYMDELIPHILAGLSNWQAHEVCRE
jgi:importin subunit beta-1